MIIAIAGAGGGGLSAAVELGLAGHEVRLWNRSANALAALGDGIAYEGVFGAGRMSIALVTADLAEAARGADALLVCVPTIAHAGLAQTMIAERVAPIPLVLNPGHTGGALEVAETFARAGVPPPPIAEFSTLTYVARKPAPDRVSITGRAGAVWAAALPGGGDALYIACALYPAAQPARDVLATALANVNMVLHPPGAILGASWVEATGGDFTFYVDGLTDGVARAIEALDRERRAVAAAFGHALPSLFDEMQAIGTIEATAPPEAELAAAIRGGTANARIMAPDDFAHRYYHEDIFYGLLPFLEFARIAEVSVPTAHALFTLGRLVTGATEVGRTAAAMGIAGLDSSALMAKVTP